MKKKTIYFLLATVKLLTYFRITNNWITKSWSTLTSAVDSSEKLFTSLFVCLSQKWCMYSKSPGSMLTSTVFANYKPECAGSQSQFWFFLSGCPRKHIKTKNMCYTYPRINFILTVSKEVNNLPWLSCIIIENWVAAWDSWTWACIVTGSVLLLTWVPEARLQLQLISSCD